MFHTPSSLDWLLLVNLTTARAVIISEEYPSLGHVDVSTSQLRDIRPLQNRFSDRGHDLSHRPAVRVWCGPTRSVAQLVDAESPMT
jgi:hypothetical protein